MNLSVWQLAIGDALLAIAASEAYWARQEIRKVRARLELMHDQLIRLMERHGVDPLG